GLGRRGLIRSGLIAGPACRTRQPAPRRKKSFHKGRRASTRLLKIGILKPELEIQMKAKRNSTKSKKRETDAIHHLSQRDPKIVLAQPTVITPPYLCPDGKGSLKGSLNSEFQAWKP